MNPMQRIRFPSIAKRAIAAKIVADMISEELRVLYVAMTRARDRLIMTYAGNKLEERLKNLVLRMDMSARELICANVSCPGTWVMLTALSRTEAGEFFQLCGYPDNTDVHDMPWLIRTVCVENSVTTDVEQEYHEVLHEEIIEKIRKGLNFRYAYPSAVQTPSKMTATQMKGRAKDLEATEFSGNASYHKHIRGKYNATEYGNALHTAMQYLDFSKCSTDEAVLQDLNRLVLNGLLTSSQLKMIDIPSILTFFRSELGARVLSAKCLLREFKFSILMGAGTETPDDQVLMQGVVDCAIIDEDSVTIIDFKTDRVDMDTVDERAKRYASQVNIYATALSRIYQKPVKAAYLYFFSIGQTFQVI